MKNRLLTVPILLVAVFEACASIMHTRNGFAYPETSRFCIWAYAPGFLGSTAIVLFNLFWFLMHGLATAIIIYYVLWPWRTRSRAKG